MWWAIVKLSKLTFGLPTWQIKKHAKSRPSPKHWERKKTDPFDPWNDFHLKIPIWICIGNQTLWIENEYVICDCSNNHVINGPEFDFDCTHVVSKVNSPPWERTGTCKRVGYWGRYWTIYQRGTWHCSYVCVRMYVRHPTSALHVSGFVRHKWLVCSKLFVSCCRRCREQKSMYPDQFMFRACQGGPIYYACLLDFSFWDACLNLIFTQVSSLRKTNHSFLRVRSDYRIHTGLFSIRFHKTLMLNCDKKRRWS